MEAKKPTTKQARPRGMQTMGSKLYGQLREAVQQLTQSAHDRQRPLSRA